MLFTDFGITNEQTDLWYYYVPCHFHKRVLLVITY